VSWQACDWARRQVTGSSTRKAILFAIATYCDDVGFCWPSQKRVAEDSDVSVDTVQRQTKILADMKILERTRMPKRRGQWCGYSYRLNMGILPPSTARSRTRDDSLRPDHTALTTKTRPHSLRHKPSGQPSSEIFIKQTPTSVIDRQIAFQKKYEGIEIIQNRIASRIGSSGWLILGGMSEDDLARLSALERQGKLDDENLAEAILKVRLSGMTT
jgi:hypothetical protein